MTLCHSHRKKDPFVRFNKSIVFDHCLSLKAKGLLSIAFSRPEDWSFYKQEMMKHCSDGEHSFDSGVKELENSGYLYRTRKQNKKNGRLEGWEWHFFEEPISEEEFKKFIRNGGFPDIGETPISGKPSPNKNNSFTKKENNNPEGLDSPAAVVVPPWDEELDELNLTEPQKLKIHKEHPEKVKLLVKRVLDWSGKPQDIIAVNTILRDWECWQDNPTPSEIEEKNAEFLKSCGIKDGQTIKNHSVYIGKRTDGTYVEFVCGQRVDIFSVSDKDFITDLKNYFAKRLGVNL